MAAKADKLNLVIPDPEQFEAARLPFGVISGEGVDDYDEVGKEYTVSMVLGKREEEWLREEIMDFWEEYKPSGAGDEPANWDNLTRTNDEGETRAYFKTKTEFDGRHNKIGLVDGQLNKLDPETYGSFGGDTEGRISATIMTYSKKKKHGISMHLSGVQLEAYEELSGGDGTSGFSAEGNAITDDNGFKGEKKKKKKGKKKKSHHED